MSTRKLLRVVVIGCILLVCVVGVVCVDSVARAADADRAALRAEGYGGSEVCGACHTSNMRHEQGIVHGKRLLGLERRGMSWDCEGCHGAAKAHAQDPINGPKMPKLGELSPEQFSGVCLQCHQRQIRRHEWMRGEHSSSGGHCYQCHDLAKGVGATHLLKPEPALCLDCHQEKQGEFSLNSHHPVVREGRMVCTDCHTVHERMALPVGDSEGVRRACTRCHKQQRGPYIFEHGAISGGLSDGCLDCHKPHSSPNRDLLKLTGRGLCLSCHPDRVTHFAGGDCISCHEGFHGSNSDPRLLGP